MSIFSDWTTATSVCQQYKSIASIDMTTVVWQIVDLEKTM